MTPDSKPPDPAAYRAFVDRIHEHQGILRRIASLYADSAEDREDLRQDVLLQAWRSYSSFREASAFSTWLYRVALHTALTRTRGERRRRNLVAEHLDGQDLVCEPRSEDPELEELRRCIRELPALDRAIVLLWLERHGYEEIAEITGLSRSNVGVRLVRIKQKLRHRLGGEARKEATGT